MSKIKFNLNNREVLKYLSYIEEYLIVNEREFYFTYCLNLKDIYFDFLSYLEKNLEKDGNLMFEDYYYKILKTDDIIINKYINSLFYDNILNDLEDTFKHHNNNQMIFISMKLKYFRKFLNELDYDFDLKIINDYMNSELYHNNNLKYFFYR